MSPPGQLHAFLPFQACAAPRQLPHIQQPAPQPLCRQKMRPTADSPAVCHLKKRPSAGTDGSPVPPTSRVVPSERRSTLPSTLSMRAALAASRLERKALDSCLESTMPAAGGETQQRPLNGWSQGFGWLMHHLSGAGRGERQRRRAVGQRQLPVHKTDVGRHSAAGHSAAWAVQPQHAAACHLPIVS